MKFAALVFVALLPMACRSASSDASADPAAKTQLPIAAKEAASSEHVAPAPVASASPGSSGSGVASGSAAPVHLGAPFTGKPSTTLGTLSDERLKFKNSQVATTGTIHSVCQEMGCWMEIVDGKTNAIVRMHNHAFFIPKTASGRPAKVEGNLVLVKDGKECDEANAKEASLQLDAVGVEIM